MGAHPGDHDPPRGVAGLPAAAGVEAVPGALAGGCRDRGGCAQVRPGGLGAEPFRVISGGDQEQRGGAGADAVQGEQAGCAGCHEGNDELVQALKLVIEELSAPPWLPQRDPGGVAGDVAGAGPQRRQAGDQADGRVLGEADPQVIGPGQDQGPGLAVRLGRSARALRLATISARIASTAPSRPFGAPRARPDCAARAALTASSGPDLPCRRRSWRSERPASTTRTPAPGDVPGQASAVAAGPLDPGQAHRPGSAQPAQQPGVTGRGDGELLDAG